jgi:O-methyltransferase involved in polyketide biosynthesis
LVLTFAQSQQSRADLRESNAGRAAAVGEPWLTYFEPAQLRHKLQDAGFSTVRFLTVKEAARYFAGRTDRLAAPRRVSIATASLID